MWICVDIGKVGECKERRAIRLYVTKQIQMYPVLFEINYRNKRDWAQLRFTMDRGWKLRPLFRL